VRPRVTVTAPREAVTNVACQGPRDGSPRGLQTVKGARPYRHGKGGRYCKPSSTPRQPSLLPPPSGAFPSSPSRSYLHPHKVGCGFWFRLLVPACIPSHQRPTRGHHAVVRNFTKRGVHRISSVRPATRREAAKVLPAEAEARRATTRPPVRENLPEHDATQRLLQPCWEYERRIDAA